MDVIVSAVYASAAAIAVFRAGNAAEHRTILHEHRSDPFACGCQSRHGAGHAAADHQKLRMDSFIEFRVIALILE